jgi:hypothetical protein
MQGSRSSKPGNIATFLAFRHTSLEKGLQQNDGNVPETGLVGSGDSAGCGRLDLAEP